MRTRTITFILTALASLILITACHSDRKEQQKVFQKTFSEGEIEYSFKLVDKKMNIMNLPWFMPNKVSLYFKSPYVKAVATEGSIMTMVGINMKLSFLLDAKNKLFVSQLTGAPDGNDFTKRLVITNTLGELLPHDSVGQPIPYEIFDTAYMEMECIGLRSKKDEMLKSRFLFIFAPTYGFQELDELYDTPGVGGIPLYARLEDPETTVTIAATEVIPKELNDSIFVLKTVTPEESQQQEDHESQLMNQPQ